MSAKMQLTAKLDQRLAMNQQLRQAITLLQYNTIELKQVIKQYIETNPLIEVDEGEHDDFIDENPDNEHTHLTNYTADFSRRTRSIENDENLYENYSVPKTLRQHLLEQTLLCKFSPVQQTVAEAIIDAINDDGFLTMSLEDIQNVLVELGPPDILLMENVLKIIQVFEPIGVGSRDIRECLLIQLEARQASDEIKAVAQRIIGCSFETTTNNNAAKIMKKLGITQQEFSAAMLLIRSLNPNPGQQYSQDLNINIEPELYVKKVKNNWQVFLMDSMLTNIKINHHYQELIKKSKKHASYEAMSRELQEAQWLIKGLKRRNETLLKVAEYIVELQKDFLEYGPSYMKPMNIAEVALAVEVHESTVSRVTTGKYIATPLGVFELKYFFPSHVTTQSGDTCSDTAVKELIKEFINQETDNRILSDSDITGLLKEKGINIARRTVAKYREALKILPSYQRSKLLVES